MHWLFRILGWALVIIAIVAKIGSKKLRWRDAGITAIVGLMIVAFSSSI